MSINGQHHARRVPPLTVSEFEEWGEPKTTRRRVHGELQPLRQQRAKAKAYRVMLVRSSNDTQVLFHQPAKWVVKLRATKTDGNPLMLLMDMQLAATAARAAATRASTRTRMAWPSCSGSSGLNEVVDAIDCVGGPAWVCSAPMLVKRDSQLSVFLRSVPIFHDLKPSSMARSPRLPRGAGVGGREQIFGAGSHTFSEGDWLVTYRARARWRPRRASSWARHQHRAARARRDLRRWRWWSL